MYDNFRLSAKSFDEIIKRNAAEQQPMTRETVELARRCIVDGETPAAVARDSGKTRQSVSKNVQKVRYHHEQRTPVRLMERAFIKALDIDGVPPKLRNQIVTALRDQGVNI